MILKFIVKNNKYESINQLMKVEFQVSSRLLIKLIKNKKILLNGITCDTRIQPQLNDVIEILLDDKEDNSNIEPAKMNLEIVYEDEGFLVINKPCGIAIHPSIRHYNDSLSNGVRSYYDKIGLKKKIRPVNRLDLNTSGLVIFAKNEYIQECLIKQMKNGIFQKKYICIVEGKLNKKQETINLPIAKKENSIIKRCVSQNGQQSITHYEVIEEHENYSFVKCTLETGRTHQIRVHMAYIGNPLLGDTLYGQASKLISRQALHCYELSFINPITNSIENFKSNLPKDMRNLKYK